MTVKTINGKTIARVAAVVGKAIARVKTWLGVAVSAGGDTYFANVVALLHFDGSDASTTFTDVTGRSWAANGNVQIDTAQSVFGGAAALFDGTTDYISTGSSADMDFGAGDFTVEFRARLAAILGSGGATIILSDAGRNEPLWIASGPVLRFDSPDGDASSSTLSLSTNTWYNLAISRVGNTLYFFQDGVGVGTVDVTGRSFSSNTGSGGTIISSNAASFGINGWIDELRITKGVGRYNANYTIAAEAFPDS